MDDSRLLSRRRLLGLANAGILSLSGCIAPVEAPISRSPDVRGGIGNTGGNGTDTGPSDGSDWQPPLDSPRTVDASPTVLVENLEIPWDLAFAPNDEMFITERTGRVLRFDMGDTRTIVKPEDAIDAGSLRPGSDKEPWWVKGGEGGTMGIAVHPRFPNPSYIYVYYTANGSREDRYNRLVRYDASATNPARTATALIDEVPASNIHNGGRLTFGPDGKLWLSTGDSGTDELSQDTTSLAGKILRLEPNGNPARDNPDLGNDADPRIFTYGHRNPQGISWLPDGRPIITEHGPGGHDEVNLLDEPGANYGWPNARKPDEYRNTPDYHRPLVNTTRWTWAPSGCVFYTGDAIPAWRNRLIIGTLRGQHINVITLTRPGGEPPPLDGDARRFDADWHDDTFVATSHKVLKNELGRVRLVTQGPDGSLYAITSNRDGRASGKFPTARDDVLVRLDVE